MLTRGVISAVFLTCVSACSALAQDAIPASSPASNPALIHRPATAVNPLDLRGSGTDRGGDAVGHK
jgi:hypothetical protein